MYKRFGEFAKNRKKDIRTIAEEQKTTTMKARFVFGFLLAFSLRVSLGSIHGERTALFVSSGIEGAFSNATLACTENDIEEIVFSGSRNLNDWLSSISYGYTNLSGNSSWDSLPVNGSLFLDIGIGVSAVSNTTCDLDNWGIQVINRVVEDWGWLVPLRNETVLFNGTVPDFDHIVIIFPTPEAIDVAAGIDDCPIMKAARGEPGSPAWISEILLCDTPLLYARAIGINFGFYNSTAACPCIAVQDLNCSIVDIFDNNCTRAGDSADIMGLGSINLTRTINAPNRIEIGGWLCSSGDNCSTGLLSIEDVTPYVGTTEFILADLATVPSPVSLPNIHALRVKNITDDTWIYVSCRAAPPSEVFYDSETGVENQTMVHVHARAFTETESTELVTIVSYETLMVSVVPGEGDSFSILTIERTANVTSLDSCSIAMTIFGVAEDFGTIGVIIAENETVEVLYPILVTNETSPRTLVLVPDSPELSVGLFPGNFVDLSSSPGIRPPEFEESAFGNASYMIPISAVVLSPAIPPPLVALIDDANATYVTVNGAWVNDTTPAGFFGPHYVHDNQLNASLSYTFKFPFTPALPLMCVVFFYWPTVPNNDSMSRSPNVEIIVEHSYGTSMVAIDERPLGPGTFTNNSNQKVVVLGQFFLDEYSNVTITNENSAAAVVALDAIKFECTDVLTGRIGTQSLLFIPVNMTDVAYSGGPECDVNSTLAEVAAQIASESYGEKIFNDTLAIGAVNIPVNRSTCNYELWGELALNASLVSYSFPSTRVISIPPYMGLTVPDYDAIVLLFPPANELGCPWTMFSPIYHSVPIVTNCSSVSSIVHVLEHTIGIGHSGEPGCSDFVNQKTCDEFGETLDIMGGGVPLDPRTINVPHLVASGWLTPDGIFTGDFEKFRGQNITMSLSLLDSLVPPSQNDLLTIQLLSEAENYYVSCRNNTGAMTLDVHAFSGTFASSARRFYARSLLIEQLSSPGQQITVYLDVNRTVVILAITPDNCTLELQFSTAVGACCYVSTCTLSLEEFCNITNGTFILNGDCNECPSTFGACCSSILCYEIPEQNCNTSKNRFLGQGTTCDSCDDTFSTSTVQSETTATATTISVTSSTGTMSTTSESFTSLTTSESVIITSATSSTETTSSITTTTFTSSSTTSVSMSTSILTTFSTSTAISTSSTAISTSSTSVSMSTSILTTFSTSTAISTSSTAISTSSTAISTTTTSMTTLTNTTITISTEETTTSSIFFSTTTEKTVTTSEPESPPPSISFLWILAPIFGSVLLVCAIFCGIIGSTSRRKEDRGYLRIQNSSSGYYIKTD